MTTSNTINVSIAGNPNCGKTTIFNALTGSRQHVGNYPGVTVEKRTGYYTMGATRVFLKDLPGTYSLTSYSPEERIAQHNADRVEAVVARSSTGSARPSSASRARGR